LPEKGGKLVQKGNGFRKEASSKENPQTKKVLPRTQPRQGTRKVRRHTQTAPSASGVRNQRHQGKEKNTKKDNSGREERRRRRGK